MSMTVVMTRWTPGTNHAGFCISTMPFSDLVFYPNIYVLSLLLRILNVGINVNGNQIHIHINPSMREYYQYIENKQFDIHM